MNEERRRLAPLGDTTGYREAAGLPDVRGWAVLGADGIVIGRVIELLVDRDEGRVRYLECELRDAREGASRLHVPVGLAQVRADRDEVEVPTLTEVAVRELAVVADDRALPADEAAGNEEEDFSYLVGVGGAMTGEDEEPELVGEVDAGQIRVPVMEEETRHQVAPEDQPGGADAAMMDEPSVREELRRADDA